MLVLLALAGLLRPEAWVLAALYWCWVAWPASWRQRALYAVLAAAGPLLWAATDYAVTGDPLFSLHYTSTSAEELGRNLPLSELPSAIPEFFASLVKLPVLVAAVLGLAIAILAVPRRAAAPLALLIAGIVHVRADRDRGRVGDRALPRGRRGRAAGVRRGHLRRLHAARARAAAHGLDGRPRSSWSSFGVVVDRVPPQPRALRRGAGASAAPPTTTSSEVLRDPQVQAGLRCGPLTLPNHKLVPDSRWIADLPYEKVRARADPKLRPQPRKGVGDLRDQPLRAVQALARPSPSDSVLIQVPPPGFERVKVTRYYTAYVAC